MDLGVNMVTVSIHPLLCCVFVTLSWGHPAKRDTNETSCSSADGGKTCVPSESQAPTITTRYGIVCDAGSTSTRLKIFQINVTTEEGPSNPRIGLFYNKRFNPSLDKFVKNNTGLRDYVTQILTEAKKIVPKSQLPDTHAYLLATAGLRFLNAADAKQLIKGVIKVFDRFHIKHFHGHEGIGILSGEEEGAYTWVAANYLLGNFASNSSDNETVGIMEMGGGSTQIAFIPRDPIYSGEFQITINRRLYNLYVHSYLQFGMTAVMEWVATVLTRLDPDSLVLGNPCMLKGDVKELQLQDGSTVLLHGTSDPDRCKQVLKQILSPDRGIKCEPKPCAIGNVYQPSVDDIKFLAIQGFTYAPIEFNALGPNQVLNIDRLEQEAFKHCRKNLTEVREAGMDESMASTNCLMGIYTSTLFTLSYGFPRNTTNIQVTMESGGESIEWSLGIIVLDVFGNNLTRRKR